MRLPDFILPSPAGTGEDTIRWSHVGVKGDLVVELHYGRFGTNAREAALYLYRARAPLDGVFVRMGDLWAFAERDAIHTLIPTLAAKVYGFVTKLDCFRLLDAIMDYLEDLKNARPDPRTFRDRSLDRFLEGCDRDGVEFFVERNGERTVLN